MNPFVFVLTRMSTAIFMLSFLAVASVLGTYVLQNRSEEEYIQLFGPFWYKVFNFFGLFNLYASWWFVGLLLILMSSVALCLWVNGRQIWRRQYPPKKQISSLILKEFHKIETDLTFEAAIDRARRHGLRVRVFEGAAYASQSKKFVYGYWGIHLSVLCFCLYGLVNAFFGWRGVMNLAEGDRSYIAYSFKGNVEVEHKLPIVLKNKEFNIDFYGTGMPKNFETKLEVYHNKEQVAGHLLQVNKPFIYGGYSIYQGTFGDAGSSITYTIRPALAKNKLKVKDEELNLSVYEKTKFDDYELEFTNFKLHNVENIGTSEKFGQKFRNLGPSVEYIIRGPNISSIQLKSYLNFPQIFGVAAAQTDAGPVYANYILGLSTEEDSGWQMAIEIAQRMSPEMTDMQKMEIVKDVAQKYLEGLTPQERLLQALKVMQAAQIIQAYELPFLVQLTDYEQKRYSGLQISFDPASRLFWLASLLMIFGVYASLYGNWVRVWVYNNKGKIDLYIKAHKNEQEWYEIFK